MINTSNSDKAKAAYLEKAKKYASKENENKIKHRKYDCIAICVVFVLALVALIYYSYAFNPVNENAEELQQSYIVIFAIVSVVFALLLIAGLYRVKSMTNNYNYYRGVAGGSYVNETMGSISKKRKKSSSVRRNRFISNTAIYIILIVMSVVWLFPFVCLVLQSFRTESTYMVSYIIPKQWGFDNYVKLFTKTNFLKWYRNTIIIALATAVLQTVFVMLMAYGLSRMRFKGRKLLMNLMLILGMFPGFLTMIILYWVLKEWGLTDSGTVGGLILVYVASSGMGYYVAKGFLDTIPKSLDEAARIDGATRFQIMYKIILPLAKPIIVYTVLTAFMAPWADFIFAKYISGNNSTDYYNVAVGLWNMVQTNSGLSDNYTTFCAGGVVVAIPVTILFMLLQKYYVEGVTGGAVKG